LQVEGRMVRFIHSHHKNGNIAEEVAKAYGADAKSNVQTMNLREIFVALAKTFRLESHRKVQGGK
ncbi:MAG: hypothetical protein ACPGVU_25085, partial [Limisphaerales bacterium]